MKKLSVLLTLLMAFMCVPLANAWDFYTGNPITQVFNESASKDLGQLQTREEGGYKYYFVDFTPESDADIEFKFVFNNGGGTTWCGNGETVTTGSDWTSLTADDKGKNKLSGLTSGVSHRFELRVSNSQKDKIEGRLSKESSGENPTVPSNLWIRASYDGETTDFCTAQMTVDGSGTKFTYTIDNYNGGKMWFRFTEMNGDTYVYTYGRGNRQWTDNDVNLSTGNTSTTLQRSSGKGNESNDNISYTGEAGPLTFTVDLSGSTPTVTVLPKTVDPSEYTYWFRSNKSGKWKDDMQLIPDVNRRVAFSMSDLNGKEFGIKVGDKDGKQLLWYIPSEKIDPAAVGKSYTLYPMTNQNASFSGSILEGEYTFVLEINEDGLPAQLRVNPPTVTGYNNSLFVGIASANRHEINYNGTGYDEYKFYVTDEELNSSIDENGVPGFGFRFYSEPNGGIWMGGTDQENVTLDTEITTSGIKRFFIREAGPYSIKVKSYEPEKKVVVFSISKLEEGAIVLDELYIGGSWNSFGQTRITSSNGKYHPFEVTVGSNAEFRFYSASNGGNYMGPVYKNKTVVDPTVEDDGAMLKYTTAGNGNVFVLKDAGKYEILVSEYLGANNKVTFSARRVIDQVTEAPATLYMRTDDNWETPIQMKYDPVDNVFTADVDYKGNGLKFHFRENKDDFTGMLLYPAGDGDVIDKNSPLTISNVVTSTNDVDPIKAWKYTGSDAETVTIVVNFAKEVPSVEVMGKSNITYYFIGDLNEWFSKEFEPGHENEKGINADKFNANKDKWKFEYDGDGWYKFTGFPGQLLTGHFQIVSGGTWDSKLNEIYSHIVTVNEDDIKNNQMNGYRTFKMNRITRDDIIGGHQYRIRKRAESETSGSNLGTQCNAVKKAELYFKPGDMPRIRIVGEPVDYFMFYNMEEAETSDKYRFNPDMKTDSEEHKTEYWVRAKINSGKPNTNNYFLAGIQYGNYTLPFVDINGNSGAHMNIGDGIDLAPYDLKKMTRTELSNLFFGQTELVDRIFDKKELPNGRDISVYDQVWVAKIPSGFEDPAGTKYNMSFTKAMTDEDRDSQRTITPRHYYFFPQFDGIHVHINADQLQTYDNVEGVDVAYRIYKTDVNYNTVVVEHGKDIDRQTIVIRNKGEELKPTAESIGFDQGWYEMTKKEESNWNCVPEIDHPEYPRDDKWLVSWENAEEPLADEASETTTDFRREVPYDDNHAFVQFRVTIKLKTPVNIDGRSNAPVSEYTVYVPESTDVVNDANHFGLANKDLYVKIGSNDAIWTGVNDILDEIGGGYDGDNATPVYYNLQGVRVDNPDKGIFIKVTGSKSEKVMF